ncbi:MAG TPA: hypothetical protein VNO82_02685 [Solirubrobacteraceae bacterium]|nr:hypothetical protein [Solirubrobacteraceae bacterium]
MTRVAGANGITEGKFDEVRGKKVLVITGRFGFKTYDVSNPENPVLLDEFMPAGIDPVGSATSPQGGYWQNEDMELDTKRKLIIGALDPRHNDVNPAETGCPHPDGTAVRDVDCKSGFYIISYADPRSMRQIGNFVSLPSGHTSSCIQNCKYIWTGGPARRDDLDWLSTIVPQGPGPATLQNRLIGDGRPIWVTDIRDPWNPKVSDQPVDLYRNDGYSDYSHDVDEDERGIAWVAGRGGIRGYATEGKHRDPYLNRVRRATADEPILVAGGGLQWDVPPARQGDDGVAQATDFMHNSGRPTDGAVRASGVKKGNVLIGTEEDFQDCAEAGRIVAVDLTDSWGGEAAQNSTRAKPYRMKALSSFHPFLDTPETANPDLQCSAHYFEIRQSTLAAGWYGQGLRLVDVSDARDMRQVGYYRVTGTGTTNPSSNSWDVAWYNDEAPRGWGSRKGKKSRRSTHRRGDYVYLMDMSRGIEVIRLKGGGARASARMKSVVAPSVKRDPWAAKVVKGSSLADGAFVCPLFQ